MSAEMAEAETPLTRPRGNPIARRLSGALEYLALLLVVVAVVGLAVVVAGRAHHEAPVLFTGSHFPLCRDVGLVPGGTRQGTCATAHAVVTLANERTLVVVPGLRARVTRTTLTRATSPAGRARHRLRVSVEVALTNTAGAALYAANRDPALRLTVGTTRVEPDPRAQALAGAFRTHAPLAPAATRRGFLRFELGGAVSDRFAASGATLGMTAPPIAHQAKRLAVVRIRP